MGLTGAAGWLLAVLSYYLGCAVTDIVYMCHVGKNLGKHGLGDLSLSAF